MSSDPPELARAEALLREACGERVEISFPIGPLTTFRVGGAAALYLEAFEGMRVTFPQTLHATGNFTQARYGEVDLSVGGPLDNPTNVVAPGPAAVALQDLNNRSRSGKRHTFSWNGYGLSGDVARPGMITIVGEAGVPPAKTSDKVEVSILTNPGIHD